MSRSIVLGIMNPVQGNENLVRKTKELATKKGLGRDEAEKLAKKLIDLEIQIQGRVGAHHAKRMVERLGALENKKNVISHTKERVVDRSAENKQIQQMDSKIKGVEGKLDNILESIKRDKVDNVPDHRLGEVLGLLKAMQLKEVAVSKGKYYDKGPDYIPEIDTSNMTMRIKEENEEKEVEININNIVNSLDDIGLDGK